MAKQAAKTNVVAVEFGNSVDIAWHPELPQSALIDALGFAHEMGFLFASQPWQLEESSVRDLENTFGYSPAGGWKRLISLAAGQKWFEATEDKFIPAISCDEIEAMTAEEFQIQLVESFTRQLCPPQTMAGILVALELHPMWGLRVAHEVRSGGARLNDEGLFPRDTLAKVQGFVFETIAGFLGTLTPDEHDRSFLADDLARTFDEAARTKKAAMRASLEAGSYLPVFIPTIHPAGHPLAAQLFDDIVNDILVPAHLAKLLSNGRVAVCAKTLRKVRCGDIESQETQAG